MKSRNIYKNVVLFALVLGMLFFYACKQHTPVAQRTRLFRPVLSEQLHSENNTVIVDMGDLKEAISYTLEVSRDTFQTIELTLETDTNYVEIDSLLWNTIYQVRATAHAEDSEFDSKVSDLGAVRRSEERRVGKEWGEVWERSGKESKIRWD